MNTNHDEQKDRAEFRALRESVGMTQQMIADVLGVQVRSVKRWEKNNPNGWYEPPKPAWDILDDALADQEIAIDEAVKRVEAIEDEKGNAPEEIVLTYWLSQADYLQWSTDAQLDVAGDWRMANANIRAVAAVLRNRGHEVRFVNGAPVTSPSFDD